MATENNREEGAKHLPGHHPNSQENLNTFQPGQSGNPAGRPKGSRNIRTILKGIDATIELCKQLTDAKNDPLREGDPKEKARLYDLIVAAQLTRALQANDLPSFKGLVDRYEGTVAQKFEDVTPLFPVDFPSVYLLYFHVQLKQ